MKYVTIIGDGMADEPVPMLGGRTPLETSSIPVMDALAQNGVTGTARTVPEGVAPGSDTAILSIFGYDPRVFYSGRSPLEAAGSGVTLADGDCSYRCNMIALEDAETPLAEKKILSHSGGSVDGESALELMRFLLADSGFADCAAKHGMSFYPSASFRHIAVQKNAVTDGLHTSPPHDHLGEKAGGLMPYGCPAASGLCELIGLAHTLLDRHPVNMKRRASGKLPANGIWFWAQGTAITLPKLEERYGKRGFVVSAVPLVWGIGALAGLQAVKVPGATGELHTDYEGKADAVLSGLDSGYDFALLHVEAPDECTHDGDTKGKLQAIEWLDSRCVARLKAGLDMRGEPYKLLVLSDHRTLTSTRGHDGEPVPFILYDSRKAQGGGAQAYTEAQCAGGIFIEQGHTLIERLFE